MMLIIIVRVCRRRLGNTDRKLESILKARRDGGFSGSFSFFILPGEHRRVHADNIRSIDWTIHLLIDHAPDD